MMGVPGSKLRHRVTPGTFEGEGVLCGALTGSYCHKQKEIIIIQHELLDIKYIKANTKVQFMNNSKKCLMFISPTINANII